MLVHVPHIAITMTEQSCFIVNLNFVFTWVNFKNVLSHKQLVTVMTENDWITVLKEP